MECITLLSMILYFICIFKYDIGKIPDIISETYVTGKSIKFTTHPDLNLCDYQASLSNEL